MYLSFPYAMKHNRRSWIQKKGRYTHDDIKTEKKKHEFFIALCFCQSKKSDQENIYDRKSVSFIRERVCQQYEWY